MKLKFELEVPEELREVAIRSGVTTEADFKDWVEEYLKGSIQELEDEFLY